MLTMSATLTGEGWAACGDLLSLTSAGAGGAGGANSGGAGGVGGGVLGMPSHAPKPRSSRVSFAIIVFAFLSSAMWMLPSCSSSRSQCSVRNRSSHSLVCHLDLRSALAKASLVTWWAQPTEDELLVEGRDRPTCTSEGGGVVVEEKQRGRPRFVTLH